MSQRTPEIRGIDQLLALPDNGNYLPLLMQDNDELLQEISDFSQAYGTKAGGKITIEINYSTDRFGQIDIAVSHTVKAPKPPKSKATAWRADSGGLTVANPNQRAMEIREVGGRRELRSPVIDN
jgi:hypothetical protein